jgi:hypothetical protein
LRPAFLPREAASGAAARNASDSDLGSPPSEPLISAMLRGAGWVFMFARRPHRVRLAASIRAIAVVDAKRLVGRPLIQSRRRSR